MRLHIPITAETLIYNVQGTFEAFMRKPASMQLLQSNLH